MARYDDDDDDDRPRRRSRRDDDDDDRDETPGEREARRKRQRKKRRAAARARLMGPAIGLIVVSTLHILLALLGAAVNVVVMLNARDPFFAPRDGSMPPFMHLAHAIIVLFVQAFILLGAISTLRASSYGMAMTVAVLSVIPCLCSSCVILGMPFGIWLIILLMNEDTQSAFG